MNQNPEQLARDKIDSKHIRGGWVIQNKNQINLNAGIGVAIREYQTNIGSADYILFVDGKPLASLKPNVQKKGFILLCIKTCNVEDFMTQRKNDKKRYKNIFMKSTSGMQLREFVLTILLND